MGQHPIQQIEGRSIELRKVGLRMGQEITSKECIVSGKVTL